MRSSLLKDLEEGGVSLIDEPLMLMSSLSIESSAINLQQQHSMSKKQQKGCASIARGDSAAAAAGSLQTTHTRWNRDGKPLVPFKRVVAGCGRLGGPTRRQRLHGCLLAHVCPARAAGAGRLGV
jgi:hypothetical protein